jgi:pimeloyl-ACP methyl ester carboxylesterase
MMNKISIMETSNGKVTIPNGELYFETTGKGEPLILIHAGFSDRRDWKYQIKDFGKEFTTIVYDQRGSGNSSVLTAAFSPADDLKALMDHLKIAKTVLVGHSIGGTIALDFALQYPESVAALVLIAPGLNGYSWSKEYQELMKGIWSVPQPDEMTKKYLSAPFYAIGMSEPNIKLELEAITKESFQKVLTWKTFDIQDVRWFFPESISKLKELQIPTFVVYGDKDAPDIKQIVRILGENIPNIKTAQIKNVDHILNFEKPSELNTLVLDFLSDCNLN